MFMVIEVEKSSVVVAIVPDDEVAFPEDKNPPMRPADDFLVSVVLLPFTVVDEPE